MRHGDLDQATLRGLKVLRERIEQAEIPPSQLDESLNLATWNIREFGRKERRKDSIHYIAEILNQFDLIALTEVRADLGDLGRVLEVLGPWWGYVVSDYATDAAGNRERVAYVFDKRMVRFTGLAAEADEPKKKRAGKWAPEFNWWRSPYMASFRAGNFDFVILTVHIRWGAGEADRLVALKGLADWVHSRSRHKGRFDKDFIVVGDMNIPGFESDAFKAITKRRLKIPKGLAGLPEIRRMTNLGRNAPYDQILHAPTHKKRFTDEGGVLDFFQKDIAPLFPDSPELHRGKKHTYQLSDHLPLWVQIDTWIEDEQLDAALAKLEN